VGGGGGGGRLSSGKTLKWKKKILTNAGTGIARGSQARHGSIRAVPVTGEANRVRGFLGKGGLSWGTGQVSVRQTEDEPLSPKRRIRGPGAQTLAKRKEFSFGARVGGGPRAFGCFQNGDLKELARYQRGLITMAKKVR